MAKANPKKNPTPTKLDETGRRKGDDRRKVVMAVNEERRKNPRRRHIDPTTCEREYDENEIEFMRAMDDYKQASGRMFPTCSEILEVLMKLGYRKIVCDSNPSPVVVTDNLFMDGQTATK